MKFRQNKREFPQKLPFSFYDTIFADRFTGGLNPCTDLHSETASGARSPGHRDAASLCR